MVLTNEFSRNGHQQGLPFALSRFCPGEETFATGAARSYRRAMPLNRQTQEKPPGRVAVGFFDRALPLGALPAHMERCDVKEGLKFKELEHAGRKSCVTFSGNALVYAWSFP
jgi:hypothetical protein